MRKLQAVFLAAIMTAGVLFSGCQAIMESNAQSTEQMLAAAGFQRKIAQTPAQFANMQAMPQRKLVPQVWGGQTMYVYTDAQFCECVYVGTEANYQEYQKMKFQKELADEQHDTAQMESTAPPPPFAWEAWGPWRPW